MLERAELVHPMVPSRYRVRWNRRETPDTVTLALDPVDRPPATFAPGQFNMLYAFGVGEVPISISGPPEPDGPLLHTVRAAGAVSGALAASEPDDVLGVRGPFGSAWAVENAEGGDLVIVAGGIGLAPLRPAVFRVLAGRDRYRDVSVLVGARSPVELLYGAQLASWGSDLAVEVTVDHADVEWRGNVGVVTELIPQASFDPARTVALVCGPEVMIRFAARALADAGIPPDRIRVSMERNMKCAIAQCGHCQFGPAFVCRDGPVFPYSRVEGLMGIREA